MTREGNRYVILILRGKYFFQNELRDVSSGGKLDFTLWEREADGAAERERQPKQSVLARREEVQSHMDMKL